ncbi:hypothetical protein DRE_07365 [Drechslerella stenobrocha 248]|uniref:Uncharacterized protein n=1 Tax=Drechslerella stenobrocha 248 TaxID=1043628 RepID=W7HUM0_9PEZI|nr:hypothetical protein DRE_07365 [Drechslerella stenobrocha 248]
MIPTRLLPTGLLLLTFTSTVFGATLPIQRLNLEDVDRELDGLTANSTSHTGVDIFDTIINNPEIPFSDLLTGIPLDNDTDAHPLEKRAKRYNALKFKVTLTGEIGHLNLAIEWGGTGQYQPFRATSADLYIFDKLGRNARDILLVWRDPTAGRAAPGSVRWMTNTRLYSFLYPGDRTEPVRYDDTIYTKWQGFNNLLAQQTYTPGGIYNGRCVWGARYGFLLGWGDTEVARNSGMRLVWSNAASPTISGWVTLRSLGYPYDHYYYTASISGQFQLKGYAVL